MNNILEKQLLAIVETIKKAQISIKSNTLQIGELEKDLTDKIKNLTSDTELNIKNSLQPIFNSLDAIKGQLQTHREELDANESNYIIINKSLYNALKRAIEEVNKRLVKLVGKEELDKKLKKIDKEFTRTSQEIDKLDKKISKIPKVDLTDYAKKSDIPKEITKTEIIKETTIEKPIEVVPNIEVGKVTTLDPGNEANVYVTKTDDTYKLDFEIPRGVTGGHGRQGTDGKDGLTTKVNGIEQVNGEITLDTDDIPDTATNRYTNDTDITRLANTSGPNTGDQDISGIGKIIHFGTVETAAATAAKTVTIADYTPAQGDILCLTYTLGTTVSSPTLNINDGGAKAIKLGGTAASSTTHTISAGGECKYCYDGTEWQMFGSMRTSDSDTIHAVFHKANKVMGAEITRFKIIFESTDGKFYPLSVGDTTAITKVQSDKPYRIGGLILWYNTTPTIAAGSTTTNTYSEHSFSTINYTLNKLTGFTNYAPIYLIGSLDTNGDFVLDQTDATSWFTQDLPSTEDGKLYLRLGFNYATKGTIHLEGTHPIYEYRDGKIQLYGASGGDYLPIVDTYADLADLDSGITKAIVRQDTLADRTYTTLDGSTQYEMLYVNPLPPLYGETYEDTYFLSTGAGGTGTTQGQVEASEDEGFRLWTLQLSGIYLGGVALAIQQNYIGGEFEISFNGKTNIRLSGGWIDNLAYVDVATDEVLDITMYDKKPDTVSAFLTCYITPASNDAANWHRVKYALQPTPFEINYSGVYEKIDSAWTLVVKNDKFINGNIGVPLPS